MEKIERFYRARKGKENYILLEGIHAFKHAFKFNAKFIEIVYSDKKQILALKKNVLEQEIKEYIFSKGKFLEEKDFDKILPYKIRSKIAAIVEKPKYSIDDIEENKPIVFLEKPANPENIGMSIRAAAAAEAGAIIVNGIISPFSASVIRASAGLIFAIPIFLIKDFSKIESFQNREIITADPEGEDIKKTTISKKSIIIFGTEREGVSEELKKKSTKIIKLNMKEDISSLNLATSVSAILFSANFK